MRPPANKGDLTMNAKHTKIRILSFIAVMSLSASAAQISLTNAPSGDPRIDYDVGSMTHTLNADVLGDNIVLADNGLTLDLNQYTISPQDQSVVAIYSDGFDGLSVRNGFIMDAQTGVYFRNGDNSRACHLGITDIARNGIQFVEIANGEACENDIANIHGRSNSAAIYSLRAKHVNIHHNKIADVSRGIYFNVGNWPDRGDYTAQHNEISGVQQQGLRVVAAWNREIDNVDFQHNHIEGGGHGIELRCNAGGWSAETGRINNVVISHNSADISGSGIRIISLGQCQNENYDVSNNKISSGNDALGFIAAPVFGGGPNGGFNNVSVRSNTLNSRRVSVNLSTRGSLGHYFKDAVFEGNDLTGEKGVLFEVQDADATETTNVIFRNNKFSGFAVAGYHMSTSSGKLSGVSVDGDVLQHGEGYGFLMKNVDGISISNTLVHHVYGEPGIGVYLEDSSNVQISGQVHHTGGAAFEDLNGFNNVFNANAHQNNLLSRVLKIGFIAAGVKF
jgi:hypothetical protein